MHLDFAQPLSEEKGILRFNKNEVLRDVLYYGGAVIDLGLCVHFAQVMSVGYFPFIGVCEYIRPRGGYWFCPSQIIRTAISAGLTPEILPAPGTPGKTGVFHTR